MSLDTVLDGFASPLNPEETPLPDAEAQRIDENVRRSAIRQRIAEAAGDVEAQLGTVADGLQMLICQLGCLAAAMAEAKDLAAVRAAAAPLAELTAPLLSKVQSGEVAMPFTVKGEDKVIEDIGARATVVAEALTSFAPDQPASAADAPQGQDGFAEGAAEA